MDDYEQTVQNSSNCLVSKARCLNWSSLYARILKKWAPLPEEMELVVRARASKERESFPLLCPLYKLLAKVCGPD